VTQTFLISMRTLSDSRIGQLKITVEADEVADAQRPLFVNGVESIIEAVESGEVATFVVLHHRRSPAVENQSEET